MRLANSTLDQVKVLPLRASVAFASRCARRVEALAQLPEGDARRESPRHLLDLQESLRPPGGRKHLRPARGGSLTVVSTRASTVADAVAAEHRSHRP